MPSAASSEPDPAAALRAELEAARDRLKALLDEAGPREAAALLRELRATNHDLAALAGPVKGSRLDDLAARRAARHAAASGQ